MLLRLTFRAFHERLAPSLTALFPAPVSNLPSVVGLSDVGRSRSRNEDSIRLLPELGVAVVADGMGGHPGGDVASRIAAETAADVLADALRGIARNEDVSEQLRSAMARSVARAHAEIQERGHANPGLNGMGTTLTAIAVEAEAGLFVLGHVGDSRAYLYRDGELTQLTRDDTWVQERVEMAQLTPEQARKHPFGHLLTQCLGLEASPVPLIVEGRVEEGDMYLLCTDGLVGMLEDHTLAAILGVHVGNGSANEDAPVRALLDAANEAGGLDNITAAMVRIPS